MGRVSKGWLNRSFKQGAGRTTSFQSGKKKIEGGYDKFIKPWVVSK